MNRPALEVELDTEDKADVDEDEEDDELSESFLSKSKSKQNQILLVALKTQIFHAQDQNIKVGFLKQQYAELYQKLSGLKVQFDSSQTKLETKTS